MDDESDCGPEFYRCDFARAVEDGELRDCRVPIFGVDESAAARDCRAALAAGLFCDNETDPKNIQQWKYPDHNFDTPLIHRLTDAARRDGEGAAICVSASGQA